MATETKSAAPKVKRRRNTPRWTNDEFRTLLEATCMCGAKFDRIAKLVGKRRAPDACRKQLRVVAERLLPVAPGTADACVRVVMANFGVDVPAPYEGDDFANDKESVFVQACPQLDSDELEIRRLEENPFVQVRSAAAKTVWHVMLHLYNKWDLPIVMINNDGTVINPDEPTGSVLRRLQTNEDADNTVKVKYRVLRLNITEDMLRKLRSNTPKLSEQLTLYNEARNESPQLMPTPVQGPPPEFVPFSQVAQKLNFEESPLQLTPTPVQGLAPEVVPFPQVGQKLTFEESPTSLHPPDPALIPDIGLYLPPPAPVPPQLPPPTPNSIGLSPSVELKIQNGWNLVLRDNGEFGVLPPIPPLLPERRIRNSRRTYALPPHDSMDLVEEVMEMQNNGLDTAMVAHESKPEPKVDVPLKSEQPSRTSVEGKHKNKPPTGKKNVAVPAKRRPCTKNATHAPAKRARVIVPALQAAPLAAAPSSSGDKIMTKWAARLESLEANVKENDEVEAQESDERRDGSESPVPITVHRPHQVGDSIAIEANAVVAETGNSTMARMFSSISNLPPTIADVELGSRTETPSSSPVDKNATDSVALAARDFVNDTATRGLASLGNDILGGRSVSVSLGLNSYGVGNVEANRSLGLGGFNASRSIGLNGLEMSRSLQLRGLDANRSACLGGFDISGQVRTLTNSLGVPSLLVFDNSFLRAPGSSRSQMEINPAAGSSAFDGDAVLRVDSSKELGGLMRTDNALEITEEAVELPAPIYRPFSNEPSLNFSGIFERGNSNVQ